MARLGKTAATILFRDGRYSVSQRTNTEAFSGYYQFPGGREDSPQESFLDIAQREVQEETGLFITQDRFIPLGSNKRDNDCDECRMFAVHLRADEEPEYLEKHKSTPWEWVTAERLYDLQKMKLIDGVVDFVRTLENWLTECQKRLL